MTLTTNQIWVIIIGVPFVIFGVLYLAKKFKLKVKAGPSGVEIDPENETDAADEGKMEKAE